MAINLTFLPYFKVMSFFLIHIHIYHDECVTITFYTLIKLRSIKHVATKVHVILRRLVVLTWMRDAIELV